jgi:hypothetical protein
LNTHLVEKYRLESGNEGGEVRPGLQAKSPFRLNEKLRKIPPDNIFPLCPEIGFGGEKTSRRVQQNF